MKEIAMKKLQIFVIAIAATISFLAAPVFAQTTSIVDQQVAATTIAPALPAKLCGRWYTPDHRYSQQWCAENISVSAGTAEVTWYSAKSGCTIRSMPVKLEVVAGTLKLSAEDRNFKWMKCASVFRGEFVKNGGGWTGKVYMDAADLIPLDTTIQ